MHTNNFATSILQTQKYISVVTTKKKRWSARHAVL